MALILSIIAITISLSDLAWNIFQWWFEKVPKVKIILGRGLLYIDENYGTMETLNISIINLGEQDVYIGRPYVEYFAISHTGVKQKELVFTKFPDENIQLKYPIVLPRGGVPHKIHGFMEDIIEFCDELNEYKIMRIRCGVRYNYKHVTFTPWINFSFFFEK